MPRAKDNFPVLAGLKSSSTGRGTLTLSFQIVGIKCIFCDEDSSVCSAGFRLVVFDKLCFLVEMMTVGTARQMCSDDPDQDGAGGG
jgi:hypothetical protein